MVIGLSTGHFPWQILLSTIVSLLSLSWGASRAFFVERVLDEADPDPAVLMVLLRVFPFMLVVILNSMMTWTSIGGLIGILVFPALLINFTTTFSLVRTFTVGIEKPFTCLKAAVYSLWLPSIIGESPKTYLVSAITSLVIKVLILAVALFCAFSGVQEFIHPRPIILWCQDKWDEESVGNLTFCTFGGNHPDPTITKCFDSSVEGKQKLRVCDENEQTLRIGLFIALTVSNILSLAASLWLNRISNYVQLYKETKKLLWRSVQQNFVNFYCISFSKNLKRLVGTKISLS